MNNQKNTQNQNHYEIWTIKMETTTYIQKPTLERYQNKSQDPFDPINIYPTTNKKHNIIQTPKTNKSL